MSLPLPVRTIAVSGGKGGVGKTSIAINLALELSKSGRSVLLLDADLSMANVDIMLNLKPQRDLSHVVAGACRLEDIIVPGPQGLHIVPAASGVGRMAQLSSHEQMALIRAFSDIESSYDVLIVDTAAGIAPGTLGFTKAAQEIVLVLNDEPASLADAYGLMKVLNREHGVKRFQVLANMVRDSAHGRSLYTRLADVADFYLEVKIGYLGFVPQDENLRAAVKSRAAVTDKYPYSVSSLAFQQIARRLTELPGHPGTNGFIEFFVEKALGAHHKSAYERGVA
ncbi:MAG: MinD/ParA family protein [Gammaproteobacteria bacterium]|nr:MinD/ParA family protein [Pseudomonadales bacterium]MCP5349038.1 MinD/ParA family protein [Pseudomonadales bacterium]